MVRERIYIEMWRKQEEERVLGRERHNVWSLGLLLVRSPKKCLWPQCGKDSSGEGGYLRTGWSQTPQTRDATHFPGLKCSAGILWQVPGLTLEAGCSPNSPICGLCYLMVSEKKPFKTKDPRVSL